MSTIFNFFNFRSFDRVSKNFVAKEFSSLMPWDVIIPLASPKEFNNLKKDLDFNEI